MIMDRIEEGFVRWKSRSPEVKFTSPLEVPKTKCKFMSPHQDIRQNFNLES